MSLGKQRFIGVQLLTETKWLPALPFYFTVFDFHSFPSFARYLRKNAWKLKGLCFEGQDKNERFQKIHESNFGRILRASMDDISIKMSLHFKYTKEQQKYKCSLVYKPALWLLLIMEIQHFFPKDNEHLHMKSACLCISLSSGTIIPYNFPKVSSYHPNNICHYFLEIPFLGSLWKNTTKLLSKCILMAQHNSITLTIVFIFIFYYLKIYCFVP